MMPLQKAQNAIFSFSTTNLLEKLHRKSDHIFLQRRHVTIAVLNRSDKRLWAVGSFTAGRGNARVNNTPKAMDFSTAQMDGGNSVVC